MGRSNALVERFPPGTPSHGMNFALIHILRNHLGYADSSAKDDLTCGMPVMGLRGMCRKRVYSGNAPATRRYQCPNGARAWMAGPAQCLNGRRIRLVPNCPDFSGRGRFANRGGGPLPPVPVTRDVLDSVPPSPRFEICHLGGTRWAIA